MSVTYSFEYPEDERIRVGFLGCGGHSFRNIYPALQYAPIDLVAVCDIDGERAEAYARQFGAREAFTDYERLLGECDLDAVFIVTGYDDEGRVTHTRNALPALRSGRHVWMEKPPANSVAEIEELQVAERETGRFVAVGLKKIFAPAIRNVREWSSGERFGGVSSIYASYPMRLPRDIAERSDPAKMRGFLDHIVHPGSALRYLGGPMEALSFRLDRLGGIAATIEFASGALGLLHCPAAHPGTAPLERLEVAGEDETIVVDNAVDVTYYRRGSRGEGGYGRSESFIGPDEGAPLQWRPEFSLAQLYNKNIFYEGLVAEILHFCECVTSGETPSIAGSDYARDLLALYEAFQSEEGVRVALG